MECLRGDRVLLNQLLLPRLSRLFVVLELAQRCTGRVLLCYRKQRVTGVAEAVLQEA